MKTTNKKQLKIRIAQLELKQKQEFVALKYQLEDTVESLKPSNLVKDFFTNTISDSSIYKSSIFKSLVGLASGYLTKKMVFKKSNSVLATLFSSAIQNISLSLFQNYFSKK